MPKIIKALKAIGLLLKNPWLLNKILEDDKQWEGKVIRQYGLDKGLPVISPEELFGDFHETVEPYAFLDGGSLPADLALLKKLARQINRCHYFEIGTWRGESVANIASVADKCYTLNLDTSELLEKGYSQDYISQTGLFSRHLSNVEHLFGNSLSYDFSALNRRFDLIFIDGDHHYEIVKNDTEKVFNHLAHENTVVVWHDYAFNPEKVRFEVLAGILDGSPAGIRQNLFHIAHTLCAVYLPGRTGGKPLQTPYVPTGIFRIETEFKTKA